jgi:hypothetical protein
VTSLSVVVVGTQMDRVPMEATVSGVAVHELRHDLALARALLDGIARSGDVDARERSLATLADLLLRMEGSVAGLFGGDAHRGRLVLSETSGTATELPQSITCNPYDLDGRPDGPASARPRGSGWCTTAGRVGATT